MSRQQPQPTPNADASPGFTDQAAELRSISTDTLIEAVHFFGDTDPRRLGHKCAAVNLSDIAAMGHAPETLHLHVEHRRGQAEWLAHLRAGAEQLCQVHGARFTLTSALLPGDASVRVSAIVVGVASDGGAHTRDGARTGDHLCVTGVLGDAGAALDLLISQRADRANPQHLALLDRLETPTPRIELGQRLRHRVRGGLDISDGLRGDAEHLLTEQAPGVVIDARKLPVSAALKAVADEQSAQRFALQAGDDYELALVIAPEQLHDAQLVAERTGVPLTVVGAFVDEPGVQVCGLPEEHSGSGYRHQFRDSM